MLCAVLLICAFVLGDAPFIVDLPQLSANETQLAIDGARVRRAMMFHRGIDYTNPRDAGPIEQRQRLLLRSQTSAEAIPALQIAGGSIFGLLIVLVAQAPTPLRHAFTGDVWIGPAVLPDGALGGGVGWRW